MPILVQPVAVSVVLTIQMLLLGYSFNQILGVWDHIPDPAQNFWLKIFFGLSVGFAFDTTALFLLGFAGWLSTIPSVTLLVIITLLAASQVKPHSSIRFHLPHLPFIATALFLFVAIILFAIRPPGNFDDTMYHLPLARHYLEQRQFILAPYLRFPLFPQNMELLFALGLMTGGPQFGGEIVAQFLANVPLFIISLGLIGALHWTTGEIWPGFFAPVLLLGLRPVVETHGFAGADIGLMLYCWAALLAIALSIAHGNTGWRCPWLLMAGLMAGMAMGTKYLGAAFITFPALWLFAVRRDWRATLVYGGTALIVGTWWYVRAWLISGDPIHPFGGNIFGNFLWDIHDLSGQLGATKGISDLWSSIRIAGVAFALAPLSLIYWRRLGPALTLVPAASLGYFGCWYYLSPTQPRYLAPMAGAVVFLGIWSLWQIGQTLTRNVSILCHAKIIHSKAAAACLSVIAVVVPVNQALEESRSFLQHWHEHLRLYVPGYSLMQDANQLIPLFGNKLLNAGFENAVYFYDGIAIGDWFGLGRYRQMIQCNEAGGCRLISPEAMRKVMLHHGARTLLVNRKRFEIDLSTYQQYFTLQQLTTDGALLTLK